MAFARPAAAGAVAGQLVAAVELADDPRDPLNLGGRRVPFMYAVTAEVLRRAEVVVETPRPQPAA